MGDISKQEREVMTSLSSVSRPRQGILLSATDVTDRLIDFFNSIDTNLGQLDCRSHSFV